MTMELKTFEALILTGDAAIEFHVAPVDRESMTLYLLQPCVNADFVLEANIGPSEFGIKINDPRCISVKIR